MTFISRVVLSIPITLCLLQYFVLGLGILNNPEIHDFWSNHALRETFFAMFLGAVVLNHIWSNVTKPKLMLIAIFGAPLVFGFWIANFSVGFGAFQDYQNVYLNHVIQVVLFVVGLLMAMSNQIALQPQGPIPGPGPGAGARLGR